MLYDKIEILFKDETSTPVWIPEDGVAIDFIIEFVEQQGWDMDEISDWRSTGETREFPEYEEEES